MRETDVAARIGGEEFACLLPSSDEAGAHGLAERIRVDLARRAIPLPDGREVTVTASLGIAAYPEGKTAEGLLRAADRALYRAKAEGKNRVASNGGARMKIQLSWTKSVLFVATAATSAYLWGQVLQPQVAQIAAPPPRSLPTTPHVVAPVVRPRVVRQARPRAAVRSVPVRTAPQGTADARLAAGRRGPDDSLRRRAPAGLAAAGPGARRPGAHAGPDADSRPDPGPGAGPHAGSDADSGAQPRLPTPAPAPAPAPTVSPPERVPASSPPPPVLTPGPPITTDPTPTPAPPPVNGPSDHDHGHDDQHHDGDHGGGGSDQQCHSDDSGSGHDSHHGHG